MAISLVQQVGNTDTGTGTLSATFVSNNTAGNMLFAAIGSSNGSTNSNLGTLSDTNGNTWTKLLDNNTNMGNGIQLWVAYNCKSSTTPPTVSISDGVFASAIAIGEVSGLATSAAFDQSVITDVAGTSPSSSSTATLANASEFVLAFVAAGAHNGGAYTLGTGYSNLYAQNLGYVDFGVESQIVSSTTGVSASFGGGTAAVDNKVVVATFKAAGGGSTVTKTQTATARLSNAVTKAQTAVSRIQTSVTKTQTAVSRIQVANTKTQSAISRISKGLTKTQTATANITAGSVHTKTQGATGRIQNTVTKAQSSTARLQVVVSKAQTATGRVAKNISLAQPAISRISVSSAKTQSAVGRISAIATKTQTATANIFGGQFLKTQTATARIIANPVIPKSYVYKVYNNGVYLGLLPSVVSEFNYAQDINTAGTQISIVVAETADISAKQSPGPITDESGNPITDESGNNLLVEGATNIVGVGTDSTLIKNGNKVVVYEFSQYYPNGKTMFSGEMERWEAGFGGDGGDDTITILANSDGQDLDNYILQGSPYVADQTQTTQSASAGINTNSKSGATTGVGQTFTTASGVTNVAAIDVMLSGTDTSVTLTLWPSVSAANSNTGALGSVTQSVSAASPTAIKFAFSSPIAVSASTSYFFTVTESAGQSVSAYYKNSNVYAGGDMYRQNYGGGTGDTLFHLTPFSDVSVLSDLYFTTYSSAGATTAAFSSVDPSTGMVETIIDKYRPQGGLVNYTSGSIDATGITVNYTFNTATVFEGIKEALALAPSGFYFYVDPGSDTLFFKNASTTADFVLTKGKHLSQIKIGASIENVKNELYFSGGLVSGSNLFKRYSNNDSITKYGPRLDRRSDNRVTTSGTANAVGTSFIAANQAEQYQTVVTVLDGTMDITLLKPGKIIGFNGFGTFIDTLLMQIVRIEYHPDYVILTLGTLPPRLNPSFERLNRELLAIQTVSNPSSPS